mgnify:CR=1 FL=1
MNKMIYLVLSVALTVSFIGWKSMARGAYESASYTVLESDGSFEIREYPALLMATTSTDSDTQGRDGSFMRLFKYISGNNEKSQKIAMTTPVFMEPKSEQSDTQMGFVIPEKVAKAGVPVPAGSDVQIRKRPGGKFAAVRFSGQLNETTRRQAEERLRAWMAEKSINGDATAESAGYDPPYKPGFLRRNEVLIRIE